MRALPAGVPSGAVTTEPSAGPCRPGSRDDPPDGERVDEAENDGGDEQHAQRGAALAEQQG